MAVNIDLLKKLREETQASIADCRMALEETKGEFEKAKVWLRKRGLERAGKKADRATAEGVIETYTHMGGKVGAMVEVLCETDFVARTDEFKNLAHEIAMQVAAMNPENTAVLLKQDYIRDNAKTIEDLVKETIAKVGENITVKRFARIAIGIE